MYFRNLKINMFFSVLFPQVPTFLNQITILILDFGNKQGILQNRKVLLVLMTSFVKSKKKKESLSGKSKLEKVDTQDFQSSTDCMHCMDLNMIAIWSTMSFMGFPLMLLKTTLPY